VPQALPFSVRLVPWRRKGDKSLSHTDFYSVEHSIRAWVKANGCKEEPATVQLPDKAKDGTTATIQTYGGDKDGAEVVLVVTEGGGHTWPGRQPALKFLGKATRNVSANEMMGEFFKKHPVKEGSLSNTFDSDQPKGVGGLPVTAPLRDGPRLATLPS
jgi:poly(3-hydroxybutyrate) depolymerase